MNRWLASATWVGVVLALISAGTHSALGVGALWSLPVAVLVTVVAMGWPDKTISRLVCAGGAVWQMALIGAWWPFANALADSGLNGPISWPLHTILLGVFLLMLAAGFLMVFLLPAIALVMRIGKATRIVKARELDTLEQVGSTFAKDESLAGLWEEYRGQLQQTSQADPQTAACSMGSARVVFDPITVANARLRLEFFRNLPGIFTGLGIIGTFSGLILGLRSFRISQDPAVVQRSLESLLGGVWQAFLVSAFAIALAIAVTIVEKLTLSVLSRKLDGFAMALDGLYPPRPRSESEAWAPRLVEAISAMMERGTAEFGARAAGMIVAAPSGPVGPTGVYASRPASSTPDTLPSDAVSPAVALPLPMMPSLEQSQVAHMLDMASSTRAATTALSDLVTRLPEAISQSLQGFAQGQQQAGQAMKTLSARLESVASGIEFSARKTLETVGARLMQSDMNMVSRHHAIADHLGELVQRIETLCGLLQQDRGEALRRNAFDGAAGFGADPTAYSAGTAPQEEYGPGFNAFEEYAVERPGFNSESQAYAARGAPYRNAQGSSYEDGFEQLGPRAGFGA